MKCVLPSSTFLPSAHPWLTRRSEVASGTCSSRVLSVCLSGMIWHVTPFSYVGPDYLPCIRWSPVSDCHWQVRFCCVRKVSASDPLLNASLWRVGPKMNPSPSLKPCWGSVGQCFLRAPAQTWLHQTQPKLSTQDQPTCAEPENQPIFNVVYNSARVKTEIAQKEKKMSPKDLHYKTNEICYVIFIYALKTYCHATSDFKATLRR